MSESQTHGRSVPVEQMHPRGDVLGGVVPAGSGVDSPPRFPATVQAWGAPALAAGALVVTGAVLRLIVYLSDRSLWHDEARLALNISDRSFTALLGELDFNQAAPPGFLLVEKALFVALGDGEWALRLFPLLCGVISLPLFWKVASRLLPPWTAVGTLALFALAAPLLYYASEVKQYGVDVTAVLVILNLVLWLRERGVDRRGVAVLAVAAPAVVFFSHGATIVLAGAMTAMVLEALVARAWSRLRLLATLSAVWAVAVGAYAAYTVDNARGIREGFRSGLPEAFAPLPPSSLGDLRWYAASVHGFADGLGARHLWAVPGVALAAAGIVSLARRDARLFTILIAPIGLTVVASGLGLYPLQFRFELFLIPIALIFVGEGLWLARRIVGVPATILLLLLTAASPARATVDIIRDSGREETKPLVAELAQLARTGDTLYVYHGAQYALGYYADCQSCGTAAVASRFGIARTRGLDYRDAALVPNRLLVLGRARSEHSGDYAGDIAGLGNPTRAWFLFAHYTTSGGVDEREIFVDELDRRGQLLARKETRGAALYLYDLSK